MVRYLFLALLAASSVGLIKRAEAIQPPPPPLFLNSVSFISPEDNTTVKAADGIDVWVSWKNFNNKQETVAFTVFDDSDPPQEMHYDCQNVAAGSLGDFWFPNTGTMAKGTYTLRITITDGGFPVSEQTRTITVK